MSFRAQRGISAFRSAEIPRLRLGMTYSIVRLLNNQRVGPAVLAVAGLLRWAGLLLGTPRIAQVVLATGVVTVLDPGRCNRIVFGDVLQLLVLPLLLFTRCEFAIG